jgi:hypothetical protein
MGEVINFPQPGSAGTTLSAADKTLSHDDVARLEAIRDNVEALLDMAARFGMMRMFHLHGRAAAMGFADRCIETAEIATDLSQP